MKQAQTAPPLVPDGTKKKALTTAPTVEQGQQSRKGLYQEQGKTSAPTERKAPSQSELARANSRRIRSPMQRRTLVALPTGADTSPTA